MRSTNLVLALGCTAIVAALPVNTTDSLTDFSISGPLVPVDTTDPTVSVVPTVPADITSLISPTSPLDGVGEDPLTGSAFLVTNGSAADAPENEASSDPPASVSPPIGHNYSTGVVHPSSSSSLPASIFEIPGRPLSVVSVSSSPITTATSIFELPGRPLSVVSVFPSPTTTATSVFELPNGPLSAVTFPPIPTGIRPIASIIAFPGWGGNLGAFSPNGFKRQVHTSDSWRRITQKRRIAKESA